MNDNSSGFLYDASAVPDWVKNARATEVYYILLFKDSRHQMMFREDYIAWVHNTNASETFQCVEPFSIDGETISIVSALATDDQSSIIKFLGACKKYLDFTIKVKAY